MPGPRRGRVALRYVRVDVAGPGDVVEAPELGIRVTFRVTVAETGEERTEHVLGPREAIDARRLVRAALEP